MVDPAAMSVWAWDARPFPAFPEFVSVWADGDNYETGHWVTGRFEGLTLERLVRTVLADHGVSLPMDVAMDGFLEGYVVDRPMSIRAALEPLLALFGVDLAVSGGKLIWRGRGGRVAASLAADDFVDVEDEPLLRLGRAQETELPAEITVGFMESWGEMRRAASASRRLAGSSRRESRFELPAVMHRGQAMTLADIMLQDSWAARDQAEFGLCAQQMALEVGDILSIETRTGARLHRITRIEDGAFRRVATRAVEPRHLRRAGQCGDGTRGAPTAAASRKTLCGGA